jgi:hypothetical protein
MLMRMRISIMGKKVSIRVNALGPASPLDWGPSSEPPTAREEVSNEAILANSPLTT